MKIKLIALALLFSTGAFAQKLSTRTGFVKFFSEAPIENIEASNKQVSSVINTENGEFAFLVPIKSFQFEKALMQEHFNENYMESGEFPKATFKGTIANGAEIDFTKDGTYKANFAGVMTMHGVEKKMEETATITIKDGKVSLGSEFKIKPADYGIEIPAGKKDNISSVIEVTVKMSYDKK